MLCYVLSKILSSNLNASYPVSNVLNCSKFLEAVMNYDLMCLLYAQDFFKPPTWLLDVVWGNNNSYINNAEILLRKDDL